MRTTASDDSSGVWLASTVWRLLEEKYHPAKVPSVRKIARHIREANGGATISHSHIHNILSGEATNITDRTREALAKFFQVPPTRFVPTIETSPSDNTLSLEEALAFRFASMRPEELEAIETAVRMVKEKKQEQDIGESRQASRDAVGER